MRVDVKKYQTLLDLAIQETGSLENVFDIAAAGNKAITDDIDTGTLELPEVLETNIKVQDYFSGRAIKPATGITAEQEAACPFGGIGYMGIEINFMVS